MITLGEECIPQMLIIIQLEVIMPSAFQDA